MITLPELPKRIAALPTDDRGYPVPWFIAWMKEDLDGEWHESTPGSPGAKPDFRIIARGRIGQAWNDKRCWICGGSLGVHRVWVVGPMCVVSRVTAEPPNHRECAEFAVKACPFLTNPREKRSEKGLPEDRWVPGVMIPRNPGAVGLYETRTATPVREGQGWLFRLGPPERIDWYACGRQATRAEIEDSIASGYPLLEAVAKAQGRVAVMDLDAMRGEAMKLLPA